MGGEKEIQKAYESILSQHFGGAVEWFLKAIELDPDNPDYHYKLSITYARSSKVAEALHHARIARRLAPSQKEYESHVKSLEAKDLTLRAGRLIQDGKDGCLLAVVYLRQALTLDPLYEGAYELLAAALAGADEYQEAIAALQDLLRLDPEHPHAQEWMKQYKAKLITYMEEQQ